MNSTHPIPNAPVTRMAIATHDRSTNAALSDTAVPTIKSRLLKAQQELRRLIRRDVALGARPPAPAPEKVPVP